MFVLTIAAGVSDASSLSLLGRQPSSMTRAATVMSNASNAFEKGQILSPDLIQTYLSVKEQNLRTPIVDPVSSEAEKFQGKNAAQASLMVADRYAQYWWNHSEAKNSSLGKRVEFVENGMKQNIVYQKGKISHKFDFSVQTFSALARLEYTGLFKAAASYQGIDSSSQVEVSEKIWNQKDLVLSNSKNSIEERSAVNLRWSW